MTLFTLLIVMALERVVAKSKSLHVATLCQHYFKFLFSNDQTNELKVIKAIPEKLAMVLVAAVPSIAVYLLVEYLPGFFVFLLYLLLLWVCLGCPITRSTYKRYLQAANREDFAACSLYSEEFGNQGGDLSNVGKQLVLINYRQYASVIIFFVLLGLPGMVFYSICKEWSLLRNKQAQNGEQSIQSDDFTANNANDISSSDIELGENEQQFEQVIDEPLPQNRNADISEAALAGQHLLFILDWLPVRITSLGFLMVGNFSKGLPVWLDTFSQADLPTYDVLARVAKACEELPECENSQLQEPLQMVKLVKRNVIFLLMLISAMTLVGVVS